MSSHPARALAPTEGEWVEVANANGANDIKVTMHDAISDGLIRTWHGWLKPAMGQVAGH
ncbi:MAG: hypothetical protein AAF251_05030 [Pseudomonadota bacterium]